MWRTLGDLPLPSTQKQLSAVQKFFAAGGVGQAVPQVSILPRLPPSGFMTPRMRCDCLPPPRTMSVCRCELPLKFFLGMLMQSIKNRLLGRLAAEVAWVDKVELGLCTFLAGHNGD